jgi:hypothetical protein
MTGLPPNLSLNPDASPAALARRPLGAGQLSSLGGAWASSRACRDFVVPPEKA